MNKNLLRLAGLIFCFSVIDVLVISYWWMRCVQTQSSFYCDAFEFGGIIFLFGIPALVLFVFSIIVLMFSKWYKGNVSNVIRLAIIILGVIIFIAPITLLLLPNGGRPKTYQGFQNMLEQNRVKQEVTQEQKCLQYKLLMSQRKSNDSMPTPPSIDCVY